MPFKYKKNEKGSTIFEAMIALIVLCFVFFAMLQIYQWCINKLFTEYSAFYATRAVALGYEVNIARRAARVAAIAISGENMSTQNSSEKELAQNYMLRGDLSGVEYEYWRPTNSSAPRLELNGSFNNSDDTVSANVKIENAPLLKTEFFQILGIADAPDCKSKVTSYDYSKIYLE